MKIWGYWATFGWAVLAFLVSQFVALGALVLWRPGALNLLLETPYDGVLITQFLLIANPVMIGVVALAVRLAHAGLRDYLALELPPAHIVATGLLGLVALIAASDVVLALSGQQLVTTFQSQSYQTALAAGWLPTMLIAAVIFASAGEEILFRGFLFRGWARSLRSVWPAIVAISLLWALMHVQYDWIGIVQIFVAGLFLGWMRWWSASTLLTFLLHALFNLEATMETVVQARFFS